MITNEQIWMALDRLAKEQGLTAGGLARAAELDQTIFNPSKRRMKSSGRPRWPSSETIAKVLNVTGISMTQFGAMVDGAGDAAATALGRRADGHARRDKKNGPARASGAGVESKLSEK